MPIEVESSEAREFRHFNTNPEFTSLQPKVKIPENPRINQVDLYVTGARISAQSTVLYYRARVPHGIRPATLEKRESLILATSEEDIDLLGRKNEFTIPQIAVENPLSPEQDWRTYVWFKPREQVFHGLTYDDAYKYNTRLMEGQVPWVSLANINKNSYSALDRIRQDNSFYIKSLNDEKTTDLGTNIAEADLRAVVDKFDPYSDYGHKYRGMLLDQINLPSSDMLAMALLTPASRAEYLAMNPQQKDAFIKAKTKEALRAVGEKTGSQSVAAMVNFSRRLTSFENGTSHDDMMMRFNQTEVNTSYEDMIKPRLLHVINLSPSKIVTMAFMEPQTRLNTLIQDASATDQAIKDAFKQVKGKVCLLPESVREPLRLWYSLDSLRVA